MDGTTMTSSEAGCWYDVCGADEIWPDSGVCALLGTAQVAVFRLGGDAADGDRFFAIDNHDPFANANVLSRGLVGNLGERLVVASPIYKQHFDLATGACIEDASVSLRTWRVRVVDGRVQIAA